MTLIKHAKKQLSLHAIIVLRTTLVLIVIGAVFILLYEGMTSLSHLSFGPKLIVSFFQAITPRTADFNTIGVATFAPLMLVMIMVFMFIGASPGGTGGGIKTTTIVVIFKWMKEMLLGRYGTDITTFKRTIPIEQAYRAFVIFGLGIATVFCGFCLIMLIDNPPPLKVLFEVFSALGTVGLSLGSGTHAFCSFSYDLSGISKLIITLIIIISRVGTITIGGALLKPHPLDYKFPEEPVAVG